MNVVLTCLSVEQMVVGVCEGRRCVFVRVWRCEGGWVSCSAYSCECRESPARNERTGEGRSSLELRHTERNRDSQSITM